MEKRRRCTIAGITVYQRTIDDKKNQVSTFKPLEQNVLSKDKYTGKASYNFACRYKGVQVDGVCCIPYACFANICTSFDNSDFELCLDDD